MKRLGIVLLACAALFTLAACANRAAETVTFTPLTEFPATLGAGFPVAQVIDAPSAPVAVGQPAPNFALLWEDGRGIDLAGLQGRPVILNFWATWCPPCREEMPALEELWQQYGAGGVVVLGVDQGESTAIVERFIREKVDTTFPILLDGDHAVGDSYFVRSLPTTFFIDRNGFIQEIRIGGPLSLSFLQDQVRKLGG